MRAVVVTGRVLRLGTRLCRAKSDVQRPRDVTPSTAVFDEVTHTGQAWDQADYRLARFTIAPKQVNPNVAQKLIAEVPPIETEERTVFCDGGHPALGHPRVYIKLDKPGNHACGYCGQRFVNTHFTKGSDRDINHLVT
ncbi:unnamed protein product [Gongylonema pulchrum]|uniref:NADH dehydrogenase [ubiquinone] iron-sulfur protein 6, mitochondrial n=1 Tax=Gongylonema pulchrum TaxID=637853 RepID=A0A183E5S4_9BILA|nr:unnamed protein product [Gongylonema pulchrum]